MRDERRLMEQCLNAQFALRVSQLTDPQCLALLEPNANWKAFGKKVDTFFDQILLESLPLWLQTKGIIEKHLREYLAGRPGVVEIIEGLGDGLEVESIQSFNAGLLDVHSSYESSSFLTLEEKSRRAYEEIHVSFGVRDALFCREYFRDLPGSWHGCTVCFSKTKILIDGVLSIPCITSHGLDGCALILRPLTYESTIDYLFPQFNFD